MMKRKAGARSVGSHSISDIKRERENILRANTPFSTAEEYKALRTNLMFSTTEEGCKIIGVTSAEVSEGKSITCLNMAITFAQAEKKVLLIDCDLRMPKISRLLGIQATPGLSNVLVNMNSLDEIIEPVKLDTAVIDVIRSGDIPPNPSELLGSQKMSLLLTALTKRYDYIFIDTPPVVVVSDAVVLSKQLTGLVLVVRSGRTEQATVLSVLSQFDYVGANVLGFVLNGISDKTERKRGKYDSHGRYKYYAHSQTAGNE